MNIDTPFPVEGEVEATEYGYSPDMPCESEWLTETENGDLLQAAADRIARLHGEGARVKVLFTANWDGVACDFELDGVVEDDEASPEIPTADIEEEPEYVGAHSSIVSLECQNWAGKTRDDVEKCGDDATHTVVMYDGNKLTELAMCDECGEPDDAADDRVWSGQYKVEA